MDTLLENKKPLETITEASTKEPSEADKAREAKKAIVIEYLRKLPVYKWAAASAGIDVTTLENWRKDDVDFSARCESAKAEAIQSLGRRATPDFILKNVDPETFKDKKDVDVTSGGKPIPIMGGSSHVSTNNGIQENK